jgi:hypothetical protein
MTAATVVLVAATTIAVISHRRGEHVTTVAATTTTSTLDSSSDATVPVACPTPPGKYSHAELQALRPQVEAEIEGKFTEIGEGQNAIIVGLGPGREPLAAHLIDKFGDALELTVGATPYCGRPGTSPPCLPLPDAQPLPAGLRLALQLDHSTVAATDLTVSGTLVVTNDGPGTFQFDSGEPISGVIVNAGNREPTATGVLPIAGVGYGATLTAGQQFAVGVTIGTALCGGATGSKLPPGTYDVVAGIGVREGQPTFFAPAAPLAVTDATTGPDPALRTTCPPRSLFTATTSQPLVDPTLTTDPDGLTCNYSNFPGTPVRVVFEHATPAEFDAQRAAIPSAISVPGVGDAAYTFTGFLAVRTGTTVTRIIAPADTDQLTALARNIIR